METPRIPHGNPMETPWKHHETPLWKHHGNHMETPWTPHGKPHGTPMGKPHGTPWNPMETPWKPHGNPRKPLETQMINDCWICIFVLMINGISPNLWYN